MKENNVKKQVVELSNKELAKVVGGGRRVSMRTKGNNLIGNIFSRIIKWK